ncbi:MAG: hypothetical protein ACW967_03785, partial [Candidatus Hodarchaeales archaeon]
MYIKISRLVKLSFSLLFLFAMSFSLVINIETSFLLSEENDLVIKNEFKLEEIGNTDSETKLEAIQTKTISWDSFQDTIEQTYTDTSSSWEFGPTPTFSLTYINGTPIGLADTIKTGPTNEWIVDVEIPAEALAFENFGLTGIGLSFYSPDNSYSYYGLYGYSNIIVDIPEQPIIINPGWFSWDMEYNASDPNPSPPPPEDVFIYNDALKSFNFDSVSNSWNLHIVGHLADFIVEGRWNLGLFVVDENLQSVSFGYRAYSSSNPPSREFFVGDPNYYEFGGFDGYEVSLTDLNGDPIYSVTRSVPFLMNLSVSSKVGFDSALIELNLPESYQQTINITGWHNNLTKVNSGWIYNTSLRYYQWVDGISGEVQEQVYGSYERVETLHHDRYKDVNGDVGKENFFLVAFNNGTIVPKIGYRYWNDVLQQPELFLRNLTSDVADNLVILNNGNYDDSVQDQYKILFNLTINPSIIKGERLWFNAEVVDTNGRNLYYQINKNAINEIGVETRVAKTKLFTSQGEVTQDVLKVNQTESFRVSSVLQGVTPDTDIQAVNLVLNGYEDKYNETSYIWS